jgi:AP2-associated kinase
MTAKYEKLSAICRSQRQEIQELKRTVAETTPPPSSKVSSRIPELGSQVLTLSFFFAHKCLL